MTDTTTIDEFLDRGRTLSDGTKMTNERLEEVFDLVSPRNHGKWSWKDEIDCRIRRELATDEEIIKAVMWYAGGVPTVSQSNAAGGFVRVQGAGYYEWVGA